MASKYGLIQLPQNKDERGVLTFGQQHDHLPFEIRRIFMLSEITAGANRGGHAHRQQHQLLIMANGSALVTVDDGTTRNAVRLERPNVALYAPPMLWLDISQFSPDSVCLVLVSDAYDEADYIREYPEFLQLAGITIRCGY